MPLPSKYGLFTLLAFTALPLFAADDATNRNIRFGTPTPARTDSAHRNDYLIERSQYVLSYNDKQGRPNWVTWSLRKDDLGKAQRGPFEHDPLLP